MDPLPGGEEMMMSSDELREQVRELRARVADLERRIDGALDVFAFLQPVAVLLTSYGLDDSISRKQMQQKVHALVEEMSTRVDEGMSVSFTEFEERILALVPLRRGDRQFFQRFIGALKLEHPSAKPLLDQLASTMAPFRS
jgi:hypothetical protein